MSIVQLKTRKGAPKISKWRRTCRTNFLGAQNAPLLGAGKWSTISALPLLRPSGCSCALLLCHLQWESHQLSDTSISPSFKCIFRMQTCKHANYSCTAVQLESEREANSDFTEHPGLHIDSTEGT